jgi:predicted RNA binding protein YcfA (HicA-like mRNA interferase family)
MTGKLKDLKNKEVIKILEHNGFKLISKGKSNHFVYYHPNYDGIERAVSISKNPSKGCPNGTLRRIIRNSGKPKKEFSN